MNCEKCGSGMNHIPKEPWWACAFCAADMVLQYRELKEEYDATVNDLGHARLKLQESERLKYESAADYLEAEAKKIPLGEGNVEKGFSSTYNALIWCAGILRQASDKR